MKERFEGQDGRRLLVQALLEQRVVQGNAPLASDLADSVELLEVDKEDVLIEQGGEDNVIYFILSGSFRIVINGKLRGIRRANSHVGEMAAIVQGQRRSASVVADEISVVGALTEANLTKYGNKYPDIWRYFAAELARRLYERNDFINKPREKIVLFVISSTEALPIAQALERNFSDETFDTKLWTDNVFKISNYLLEDLENEIDHSDFAVAIAHPDDHTRSRGKKWPAPRDNVIFELGLFMGRLGRKRAILMESRGDGIKLPSDLAGVTTVPYTPFLAEQGLLHKIGQAVGIRSCRGKFEASMLDVCDRLRKHIYTHGKRE